MTSLLLSCFSRPTRGTTLSSAHERPSNGSTKGLQLSSEEHPREATGITRRLTHDGRKRVLRMEDIPQNDCVAVLSQNIFNLASDDGSVQDMSELNDMSIHIESVDSNVLIEPVHVFHLSTAMARIPGAEDYAELIRDAIKAGDDLLWVFLQRAFQGKGSPLNKYVVVAPGLLHSVQLECELCSWATNGQEPIPALMIRHSFPLVGSSPSVPLYTTAAPPAPTATQASTGPPLKILGGIGGGGGHQLLEEVPALLTLCDMDGRILFQNGKSIAMFGNLMESGALEGGIFSPMSFLKCLLSHNDLFEEMMQSVADGLEWRRMVWIEPPQATIGGHPNITSEDKDEGLLLCGESRLPSIDITASCSSSILRTPNCGAPCIRPLTPRPSGFNFHQLDDNEGISSHSGTTGHPVDYSRRISLADLIEASGSGLVSAPPVKTLSFLSRRENANASFSSSRVDSEISNIKSMSCYESGTMLKDKNTSPLSSCLPDNRRSTDTSESRSRSRSSEATGLNLHALRARRPSLLTAGIPENTCVPQSNDSLMPAFSAPSSGSTKPSATLSPSTIKIREMECVPDFEQEISSSRSTILIMTDALDGTMAYPSPTDQAVVHSPETWHEIVAKSVPHPSGHGSALLVMQTDMTHRAKMESTLAEVSEAQLSMLCNIFPRHVIEYLTDTTSPVGPSSLTGLAKAHEQVTVMFMDIVDFTSMSKEVSPGEVMGFLNELFTMFDNLVDHYKVQKVETAGDCYIVAGGILRPGEDGFYDLEVGHDPRDCAQRVMSFAKDILRCSREVKMPHNGKPVSIRIGLHTGACVSGLVGTKLPKFSIFGDTMNTASRMESTGKPGCIQVSEATMELLSGGDDEWISSGGVEVKGKGHMDTFLWAMPEGFLCGPVNAAASSSSSVRISFLDLLGACKGDDASHQGESGPLLGFSARLDFLTMMSETDRSKRSGAVVDRRTMAGPQLAGDGMVWTRALKRFGSSGFLSTADNKCLSMPRVQSSAEFYPHE